MCDKKPYTLPPSLVSHTLTKKKVLYFRSSSLLHAFFRLFSSDINSDTMIALVFALLSLVGYVASQAAPSASGVPPCLLSCSQASCPTNDLTCLCVTQISAITVCVLSNCSAADQQTAAGLAAQECGISLS